MDDANVTAQSIIALIDSNPDEDPLRDQIKPEIPVLIHLIGQEQSSMSSVSPPPRQLSHNSSSFAMAGDEPPPKLEQGTRSRYNIISWRSLYTTIIIAEFTSLMYALTACTYEKVETWTVVVFAVACVGSIAHVVYSFNAMTYRGHCLIPYGVTPSEVSDNRWAYAQSWLAVDILLAIPIDLFIVSGVDPLYVSMFRFLRLVRLPSPSTALFLPALLLYTHALACVYVILRGCHNQTSYVEGLYYAASISSLSRYASFPHSHSTSLPGVDTLTMLTTTFQILAVAVFVTWQVRLHGQKERDRGLHRLLKNLTAFGVDTTRQREVVTQYDIVAAVVRGPSYLRLRDLSPCVSQSLLRSTKVAYLRRTKLFAKLTDSALQDVADVMTDATHPARYVIADVGDIARGLIILLDGVLEVVNTHGDLIGLLQPGSWFGESCLLQPSVRIAKITSVTRVMILTLLLEDALLVGEDTPEVMALFSHLQPDPKNSGGDYADSTPSPPVAQIDITPPSDDDAPAKKKQVDVPMYKPSKRSPGSSGSGDPKFDNFSSMR